MTDETFPKRDRLRKRRDFKRVENSKTARLVTRHLIILIAPNATEHARIGITASRKTGKAVQRNRIKRLLREMYRKNKGLFRPGYDYVLIVRPRETAAGLSDYSQEISGALKSHPW